MNNQNKKNIFGFTARVLNAVGEAIYYSNNYRTIY